VLTGGQTGVDTLAARAALGAGLPVHLVFPLGFRQEDGNLTAARRRALRGAALHQLGSASFAYRTQAVVYLSDAVLLLDPAGGDGCAQTALSAQRFGRPLISLAREPVAGADVSAWLGDTGCRVLAIAGCRASLLDGQHAGRVVEAQLAAIIPAASGHHARLLGPAAGES
jgi:Circularly permutated YpsA SLOG family